MENSFAESIAGEPGSRKLGPLGIRDSRSDEIEVEQALACGEFSSESKIVVVQNLPKKNGVGVPLDRGSQSFDHGSTAVVESTRRSRRIVPRIVVNAGSAAEVRCRLYESF